MDDDLISVIVPVYKVEKYLDRCVESIVNQTYKNLEIILVDDGSPDNCPAMCDAWAKKDSRIKAIHKENGGLSDARNAGMAIATGEYISFIDSDDWIDASMLERLLQLIEENECDVASSVVRMVWENKDPNLIFSYSGLHLIDGPEDALKNLIENDLLIQTVWNKLYRYELIKDIPFPKGKINEDEYWSWQVFAKTNKVVCTDEVFYNYFQRNGSIMRGSNFNPMDALEANCLRLDYVKRYFPNLYNICYTRFLYNCLFQSQRAKLLLDKITYKKISGQILNIVKSNKPTKEYIKALNFKQKIRMLSIAYCFSIVCFFQNLLEIGNETNIQ